MKKVLSLALALVFTLLAILPVSAAQLITADGKVVDVEIAQPAQEEIQLPQKDSKVPFRGGTGTIANQDKEAAEKLGGTLYVGGTYLYTFVYENDTTTKISYKFDRENSTGDIALDEQTGLFTVTAAGPFIIEIWADGQYAFDSYFRYVEAAKPVMEPLSDDPLYAAALEAAELTVKRRTERGGSKLTVDPALMEAAMLRAGEMEVNYSHYRPNGDRAVTWARELMNATTAAENIAYGQKTPSAVVEAWLNSPGHLKNIVNEKYTKVGVGCYRGADGTLYWVQLFSN